MAQPGLVSTDNLGMRSNAAKLEQVRVQVPAAESDPTRPATELAKNGHGADGRQRPLSTEDVRFVSCARPVALWPQLRVRQMLASNWQTEFVLYPDPPVEVRDITVTPQQFIMAIKDIAIDAQGMLAKGVVPINVSDLDGTLWKEPVADILVYGKLCAEKKLKPIIRGKLNQLMENMRQNLPRTQELEDDLVPHGQGQPDAGVNEDVLRARAAFDKVKGQLTRAQLEYWSREVYPLTSWALAGFTVQEVKDMTRDLVRAKNLKQGAFRGARAKILALQRIGIPTVLFSASNTILAQAAVDEIFSTQTKLQVIGTDVRVDRNDVLTTEVINGGPCFRENKLAKVKAFLREYAACACPQLVGGEPRPLLASGDSPSKTDEQMMELAVFACADEPGTTRDVEVALARARANGRYFILDYQCTVGQEPAGQFQVERPDAGAKGAL